MNKSKLIWPILAIVLTSLFVAGGWWAFKTRDLVNSEINKNFPGIIELGKTNLPGALKGPQAPTKAKELKAEEIIRWTNFYREQEGLKSLILNESLTLAAQKKTKDMFENKYFEHVSPTGVTPSDLVASVGYNYKVTGENLALGDFKDEKDLVDAWMASPGHRANILNAEYTQIGVFSELDDYPDREQTWISTQEFGQPAPDCSLPDKALMAKINNQKLEYSTKENQISSLQSLGQDLLAQGNAQIDQGNTVYSQTNDASQAQPYWDEGKALQAQAQQKQDEAQTLQTELPAFYQKIQSNVNKYNQQVNTYNECIQ